MDFDSTWVNFYESRKASNTVQLEYQRSLRFIDAILSGKLKGFEEYEFAKAVIEITKPQGTARKPAKIAQSVGA